MGPSRIYTLYLVLEQRSVYYGYSEIIYKLVKRKFLVVNLYRYAAHRNTSR